MANDQELIIKIKAQADQATKEIAGLTKEVDKLTKANAKSSRNSKGQEASFDRIGKAAGSLNKKLVALVATYASFSGAKALVKTSAEVEEGFINVAKTTGLAGEEMSKFKEEIYKMSTSMAGVKLEGLQQIAEAAGQLGISGTDNILEFTRVITMMATTTELSAEEAAQSMAQLGNSLGIPVENYEKLGSAINELSNTTTASAGDLINYAQRIAGMGKTFGLSAEEILAFSATLKDVGISAELGGTAVSKMMMEMLKNTKGFADIAGVSLKEYSNIVKTEPVKAIQLFLDALGKLDKSAKIKALDDLKLKSSGTTQTMLKLSGATDKLTTALNTSKTAWEQNTSLQKEYATASDGFNAQMDRAENAVKVLAGRIGEELLPKLKELIDKFVEWVSSLSTEEIKKYSGQIADMAKTFGELIGTVGSFAVSAAGFVADNATVIVSLYALIKAVNLAKSVLFVFGTNGLGAVGASAPVFVTAMNSMTKGLGGLWKGLIAVIGAVGPWGVAIAGVVAATSGAVAAVDNYTEGLKKAAEADLQSASDMDARTAKILGIGEAYRKADEEVLNHGNVMKSTRDTIEQALNAEIAAIERQLDAWNSSGEMTQVQERNFFALSETLGTLKAKLDILPTEYTLNMETDTGNADKEIEKVKDQAEDLSKEDYTVNVDADTESYSEKMARLREESKVETVVVPVNADTKPAEGKVKALEASVKKGSTHPVKADTSAAQKAIAALKKPTSSTHTVYIKEVRGHADGGLIQKHLSSGGMIPGYDASDSDKVLIAATGGEFMIKRTSADSIGEKALSYMNDTGRLPSSSTEKSQSVSPLQPINLTIGQTTYKMMSDEDVALALQRNLEQEGGL